MKPMNQAWKRAGSRSRKMRPNVAWLKTPWGKVRKSGKKSRGQTTPCPRRSPRQKEPRPGQASKSHANDAVWHCPSAAPQAPRNPVPNLTWRSALRIGARWENPSNPLQRLFSNAIPLPPACHKFLRRKARICYFLYFTEIVFFDSNQMRLHLFGCAMAFEELDNARDIGIIFVSRKARAAANRVPILE